MRAPGKIALIIFLLSLYACGIEDYKFLRPVSSGDIQRINNSQASILLPNFNLQEYYYFTNFTIYYRIYISGVSETGDIQHSQEVLSRINSTLGSDYAALSQYTDNDTSVSTNISSLFGNRKYYTLGLANASVNSVLGADALGKELIIDFTPVPGRSPTISVNGREYQLYRSTGNGDFSPRPDRYFLNSPELNANENAVAAINDDVASNAYAGENRYTYINMYILVTGSENYTSIFSQPTYIGIFRLPDA